LPGSLFDLYWLFRILM